MVDILVGEVGDALDGFLLDGETLRLLVADADGANLEPTVLIFLQHLGGVDLDVLHGEGRLDNLTIVVGAVLKVAVLRTRFPTS